MITIALAGILTAVAAPSMSKMIRANRVQTEASALMNDLQFARTEAVKRGSGVTVCPSSDGATCLGTNSWQSGWIVFNDDNSSGTVDTSTDKVLRARKTFTSNDTAAASPSKTYVLFNREGFTSNLGTSTVTFAVRSPDAASAATRCVAVNIGGRMTSQTSGQGSCS
jgi:type IV fimbrial biogenesis protein FimT